VQPDFGAHRAAFVKRRRVEQYETARKGVTVDATEIHRRIEGLVAEEHRTERVLI
jgi:hypothetical protein